MDLGPFSLGWHARVAIVSLGSMGAEYTALLG